MRKTALFQHHAHTRDRAVQSLWHSYTRSALVLAIATGFLLGSFTALLEQQPASVSLALTLAQLHGELQLIGFLGLFTLGVLFHFFPRLRGVASPPTLLQHIALIGFVVGLLFRMVGVLLLSVGWMHQWSAWLHVLAGGFSLIGGSAAVLTVGWLLRQAPPAGKTASRLFTVTVALASLALLLAVAVLAWGFLYVNDAGALPARLDIIETALLLEGFVVPIALVMATRLFPLFFQLQRPRERWVAVSVGLVLLGLACRILGLWQGGWWVWGGQGLIGGGMLVGLVGLRLCEPRRQLPRAGRLWYRDPLHWLLLCAHAWLALAGGILLWHGFHFRPAPMMLEWHLVGLGYLVTLVLAVGSHLLPGFLGVRLRSQAASWVLLGLSQGAVLCRLIPFVPMLPLSFRQAQDGAVIAGMLGLLSLALFSWNTQLFRRVRRGSP